MFNLSLAIRQTAPESYRQRLSVSSVQPLQAVERISEFSYQHTLK